MSIKAYKGFNKDMTCRGFQFKEGETYHEDEAKMCEKGFHACLDPLDCFNYYDPAHSVYHEVELDDVTDEKGKDSKICGKTLKVGAAISFGDIAKITVDLIFKSVKNCFKIAEDSKANTGNAAKIGSSGNAAKIDMQGERSVAMCAGNGGKIRGKIGDWITLAEWDWDTDGNYYPKCVKTAKITGKTIKPDTWYILKGGKFVEVENDEQTD